ncbi:MAG TPA: dienelactone hydrolase family protein [Bryobacteraceae bacterium]|nr:dienelactone hydrolase family protein [Bryobacteraceae bacterium]
MNSPSFRIPPAEIEGDLAVPKHASGVVLFAHGSGSSRFSPRNRFVAGQLNDAGFATLLVDLLTPQEDVSREGRFDIGLLTSRVIQATDWLRQLPETKDLPLGYFGASTGSAAALKAAAQRPGIFSVVSRGGRPDLAMDDLPLVPCPTLLIVGGNDNVVLDLNRKAQERLRAENYLAIVPEATHLFEEPGALEEVARIATEGFKNHVPEREKA